MAKDEFSSAETPKSISYRLGLVLLGLCWFFQQTSPAQAFVATEIDFNVIELRSSTGSGLTVSSVLVRKLRRQNWIYFCVQEKGTGVTPSVGEAPTRCFYGPALSFENLNINSELQAVEYGLKPRIKNDRGKIPFGKDQSFYPAFVIRRSR